MSQGGPHGWTNAERPEKGRVGRRTFMGIAALGAATLAVPVLRAQSQLEKPRLTIAVGGKPSFYHLPLTIAEQLGYFRAAGLDVRIVDHPGGTAALQSLIQGDADVCSGAFEHTVSLQSRGQFYRAFVLQGRAPEIVVGVSSRTMPLYREVGDLKGRTMGVTGLGAATHRTAELLLMRGGLKPGDVHFVPVGGGTRAADALRSGAIDALSSVDPTITQLEQRGEIRVIADSRTLKGTLELFDGPMPGACLHAPQDFLQAHPRTVQAITFAMVHALKWLQTAGPSDILTTVPQAYQQGDRALYLASFGKVREAISPDGLMPDNGPATAVRSLALVDPTVRPDRIDTGRLFTNEFARRAKDRFLA